jgi:carboxypeptidase C (cathepsin A)
VKCFVTTVALAAFVCAAPAPVPAATRPAAAKPYPDAVTHHALMLHGKRFTYTARAGLITLRDDAEKPSATMFFTAFTADNANPQKRPITFFYNGGPGSSTIWLRMGSFGPVRAVTNGTPTGAAPFHLVDNQQTLLDTTDLVFVDITDSGFGRIVPGADPKKFFSTDGDLASFAQFIERYLNTFGRSNSPKFLFGESYGTARSAMLANYLQNANVGVNGIVLQSSLLDESLATPYDSGGADTDDWQYVFELPTLAATAYHYRLVPNPPATLAAFVDEASHFAMGEYREALALGSKLPPERRAALVSALHRYTGLSQQYISNSNLRILGPRYVAELRRELGRVEGIYDAQVELSTIDRAEEFTAVDPSNQLTGPPYFALQNAYLRETLRYNPPLLYRAGAYAQIQNAGGWDFRHNGALPMDTAQDLALAMVANPSLRIFSANGYFDLVTPFLATVYTLGHLGVDPSLRANVAFGFYESGHLVYANERALQRYHDDLERWYTKTLEASTSARAGRAR